MIAIVTSRSFLLCEAVNHITMCAEPERMGHAIIPWYNINIDFIPCPRSNQSQNGSSSGFGSRNNGNDEGRGFVTIKVMGEEVALKLFKELVTQIREQVPDQAYLDKMIDRIINGEIGDIKDEPKPVKASSARQKKR